MNLLLVDDEIAMLHIMEKAIDWKKNGIQKVFTAYNTDLAPSLLFSWPGSLAERAGSYCFFVSP